MSQGYAFLLTGLPSLSLGASPVAGVKAAPSSRLPHASPHPSGRRSLQAKTALPCVGVDSALTEQLCLPFPGDAIWAPSVLPHGALGTLSHYPQPHFGRRMESKVSEGGLNVTLTIRLLMHGKVRSPRPLCQTSGEARGGVPTASVCFVNRVVSSWHSSPLQMTFLREPRD